MRSLVAVLVLCSAADAKPLAASCTCSAIDEAAQRTKLDPKKKTARPKTVHKVECAITSTDARLIEAKASGRATWPSGHAEVDGKPVGDVQVKKDMRRMLMVEFETDPWPKCDDVELALAVKDPDGGLLWQLGVKTAGSCKR